MEEGNNRKSGFIELVSRFVTGRKRTTEQDINDFIEASEEEGLVNEEESEMLRSIFSLGTTIVREVMITRTEMACVTVDATIHELLDIIITCGHSRIPVYEDSIDNIIGLLYAKDLLKVNAVHSEGPKNGCQAMAPTLIKQSLSSSVKVINPE